MSSLFVRGGGPVARAHLTDGGDTARRTTERNAPCPHLASPASPADPPPPSPA